MDRDPSRGGQPPISREDAEQRVAVVQECVDEGWPLELNGRPPLNAPFPHSAVREAATRIGINPNSLRTSLNQIERLYGLKPTPRVSFTVSPEPDADVSVEELIERRKARHRQLKAHHHAVKLRTVQIHHDGPIGLAFFGDPHVDDDGCAWDDLHRDVELCRTTPGVYAVDVGDDSNNWVGRLAKLYAHQESTSAQALRLVEWLMNSLPWLVRVLGNHDHWNTDKGDPARILHRGQPGILADHAARLRLVLPGGAECFLHVRHDFPGGSQFNPAHALVRETLFGFRDHILVCGHRHSAGYIPIWHNDPRRMCHGFRVGTYKDFDHYAQEKGFQDQNWARAMGAVIDPAFADDPVRFITPARSIPELVDLLAWRRSQWEPEAPPPLPLRRAA